MRAKRPHWPLDRVKELCTAGRVFLSRSAESIFETPALARLAAETTLAALTERSFAESIMQTWDTMDVYGVHFEDEGFYLKLYIDEAELGHEITIVSFHPLKHPLRTNGGVVNPKVVPPKPTPRRGR